MARTKIPVRPATKQDDTPPPPKPLAHNSADEIANLTADEARKRLMAEGKDLAPEQRKLLQDRAASNEPPRRERELPASPYGHNRAPELSPLDAAALEDDDLVMCLFPDNVTLTIKGHRRVKFGMGRQPVPRRFVEPIMDSYLHACGVRRA